MNHQPLATPALEHIRGEERRHRDLAARMGEDVLAAGHPGQVTIDVDAGSGDAEAHLAAVSEDRLPGLAHGVPARQQTPARMDTADMLAVGPDLVHLGDVQTLEG